ncbi:MAG TPA: pectinesterase family protein [Opitutaceae bacterium]|jgi:pectinesterase|nr:pectinesterase family protein [Opitutaceae bacterium]
MKTTPYVICLLALLPFTARAAASAAADATVAQDGSGQYTSIQDAIEHSPHRSSKNDKRWVILVKNGTYHELVYIQREYLNLAIIGEDADHTILTNDLNSKMVGLDGKPIGTFGTPTLHVDSDGAIFENLTVSNTAAPGVGQALALRVDADRVVFRGCKFIGFQDTVLLNRGRQYFEGCTIQGLVDFIFGGSTAFFEHCSIICLHTIYTGFVTAASTPEDQPFGFVFRDCTISGPVPDGRSALGRPWREYAKVVYINTNMSGVISPAGWDNWDSAANEKSVFYAEYNSTGAGANPGSRPSWIKRLTEQQAAEYTIANVLGGDDRWKPAPSIAPAAK